MAWKAGQLDAARQQRARERARGAPRISARETLDRNPRPAFPCIPASRMVLAVKGSLRRAKPSRLDCSGPFRNSSLIREGGQLRNPNSLQLIRPPLVGTWLQKSLEQPRHQTSYRRQYRGLIPIFCQSPP